MISSPETVIGSAASGNVAGPVTTEPSSMEYWLPWHAQLIVPPETSETMQVQRNADETKAKEPSQLDDRSQTPPNANRADSRPRTTVSSEAAKDAAKTEGSSSNQAAAQPELRREVPRFEADSLEKQSPPSSAVAESASGVPASADAAAPSAAPAQNSMRAARSPARAQFAQVEIVSPDPSVRWRVAGSVVQHSTTGGAQWDTVSTGVASPLTAGAAPSVSVCWLVGRAGVVLLSTDGLNWRRVAFPEVTDLSAIQATDARNASVSTADGRTFSTTDGGATWVRRPPQDF